MGNEIGNGNVNGLGGSEQDMSNGTSEPSSFPRHDAGLRIAADAATTELENPHGRKASGAGNYTSEADDTLILMQGLITTGEDEERKQACANITLDTGETLPDASVTVVSDINDCTGDQLLGIKEGTVGVDEMIDKMGKYSREPFPHKYNIENGPSAQKSFRKEDGALELEKDSYLKEAEATEITIMDEGNVAEENNRGFDDKDNKMGGYSKEPTSHRSDEEIEPNEEEILLKGVDKHEMEINENDNLLKKYEAHVVDVVGESNVADQNSTEDGEYHLNGSIAYDRSQLDSQSIEHECSVYLDAIDAQIRDAFMDEKEEEAKKILQLEGYEFKPVFTTSVAKNEKYLLKNEETIENMYRPTIELKVDGQTKDEPMEKEEKDTEKLSSLEIYEIDPNPTTTTVNFEEYFLEKEEKVDYTFSCTTELKVDSAINEPEEKDVQVASKETVVPVVLLSYDMCERESMHSSEHLDTQNLETEKYIEDLYEEKDINTNVHCEAKSKHVLIGNGTEEANVVPRQPQTLKDSEIQFFLSSTVSVERSDEERVEKAELLIIKEDSVAEEKRLTCQSFEKSLTKEPSSTNSVQEEQVVNMALSRWENTKNSEAQSSLSSMVIVERLVEERVEKTELLIVKEDTIVEERRLTYGSLNDPLKEEPFTTNYIQEKQLVNMSLSALESTENSETQSSLSSIIIDERALVERAEKIELLIVKEDNVVEEIRLTYSYLDEPPKEVSATNSVQEEQLVSMAVIGSNTISPPLGSDNIKSEYFTGSKQACVPRQPEIEEYKEKASPESYPEICSSTTEDSAEPCNFQYQFFQELGEPNANVQSETIEKKEISIVESDVRNYNFFDFDVKKCSKFSSEDLKSSVSSLSSPTEGNDTAYLPDKKDPSINQGVTDDTNNVTCIVESDLDGNGGNSSDEGIKFSWRKHFKDPVTLGTTPGMENKRCSDEEDETHVHHEILHEFDCENNEQVLKFACEPYKDLVVVDPVDHDNGLEDSNSYPQRLEYDKQSLINWNHNVLYVDANDCSDTRSDFEESIANNEHATPKKDKGDSSKKLEEQLQIDSEPHEEEKSTIVEHQSVQHSMASNSKSQGEECRGVPTTELNQGTPSMKIAESRDASTYGVMSTRKSEVLAPTIESENFDPTSPQHMTSVKGPISVSERSGFDAQANSPKSISTLQVLQMRSSKDGSASVEQSGSDDMQSRTLVEGDVQLQNNTRNAKADLPSIEARNESNQDQLPQQQKSNEEVATASARASSERLRAPLLSFFKDEVNLMESQGKGDNALKNASNKMWRSSSRRSMATSHEKHEKQKSRSSFFSNCMCCTTVPQ